jgi:Retroviral aspartyl protease
MLCTKEVIIFLHATHSNPLLSTLKFKGYIDKASVCALIDSGSTYSFVDPAVLQGAEHQIEETYSLIVMMANGACMVTDSKCTSLQFHLQGHEFQGDFRLLQIKGYDMIFRLDWMSQFEPMLVG